MMLTSPKSLTIYISHAFVPNDRKLCVRLKKSLQSLAHSIPLIIWSRDDLQAGQNMDEQCYIHLTNAELIIFLLSADFFQSDYLYHVEIETALKRYEAGEAKVISILLRPTYWEKTSLSQIPILPKSKKPITLWRNQEEAIFYITKEVSEEVSFIFSQSWFEQSHHYVHSGAYSEALEAIKQAIDFSPTNIAAWMSYAMIVYKVAES